MSGPTRTATACGSRVKKGRLISSSGGVATTSLDPEQKDDYTYDMSVWLERELIANLGVRAGFVHRAEQQRRGTINTNQPFDAFNIATTRDAIRARTAGRERPTTAGRSRRSTWRRRTSGSRRRAS